MSGPTDADTVATWQNLVANAGPDEAARVDAAARRADLIWQQTTTDPNTIAATPDAGWARAAVDSYHQFGALADLAGSDVASGARCWADPAILRAWLTGPSTLPGYPDLSVADSWNIDDDFSWDLDGIGTAMGILIEQAQHAAVYGVPGYTITLRQVTTDDPDADPIIEHQVTLATRGGATLASDPIPADHLADTDLSGVDAAVAVLANTAAVVDELLAAARRLVSTASAPHALSSRNRRGFAALDLAAPPAIPAAVDAPTPPARPPRR